MGFNLFGGGSSTLPADPVWQRAHDAQVQRDKDAALSPPPPPPPTTLTTNIAATTQARLAADLARRKATAGSTLLTTPATNVAPAAAVTAPRTLIGS